MDIHKYKDIHLIHIYEDMLKYVDIHIFEYICFFKYSYSGFPWLLFEEWR